MIHTAQSTFEKVLVTEAGSLLGFKIADFYLKQGKQVFGVGRISPPDQILKNPNFTLLDIDISQPFPAHIQKLDLIVHLLHESTDTLKKFTPNTYLTTATNNIISKSKEGTKVILIAPLETNNNFWGKLSQDEQVRGNLELYLVGDVYGPNEPFIDAAKNHPHTFRHHMRHFYYHNGLTSLIAQAVVADRVVLEDEGLHNVYPTYIDDVLEAIEHFQNNNSKNVRIIVSQSPQTALSCAYDIQKIARVSLDKELKLFFSGLERHIEREPHPLIHLDSLGFKPEVKLEDGLKKTLEFYKEMGESHPTPQNQPPHFSPRTSRIEDIQKRYQEHIQTPPQSKFRKITSKIPLNRSHFKTKKIILAALILFFLIGVKTSLDIYLAASSLKAARESFTIGDLNRAEEKSKASGKSFKAAANKLKIITFPFSPIFPTQVTAINDSLSSAYLGTKALNLFSQGARALSIDLASVTSSEKEKTSLDTETAGANFQEAYLTSTQALKLAQTAKQGNLFLNSLQDMEIQFRDLTNYSSAAAQFAGFLPDFIGKTDKKTYLVLVQDNSELRPGGGLIISFSEIVFNSAKLASFTFQDIYTIESNLEEKIEPPKELSGKLGIEQLYLRDSNWSTDFTANAATARDFYQKETGKSVDGVIAIDTSLLKSLLGIIGPLNISGQDVSGDNIAETLTAQTDNVFLANLSTEIFNRVVSSISNSQDTEEIPFLDLFNAFRQALYSKHILASFDDKNLSSLVKTKAWNNSLPPVIFDPADDSKGARDFLALSEANLGANKVNRFIERNIDYEMTVGKNGSLTANLKITYKNNSQRNSYTNFLRVYAPFASSLTSYSNGENEDLDEVEVTQASNLQVFSTFVEAAPNESKVVEFTYKIPKTIKLEKSPSYNLYVSKQPGTLKDPFTFTFNLPENIQIESVGSDTSHKNHQNYSEETNLEVDRQFEISLLKK